jgi:transcriptional regulator with XRE-family HTH domain
MTPRKFRELRDALYDESPDSRERVADKVRQLNDQLGLADLRARRSRTQAQLADAIGTTQSAVSRLERQQDLLVSTLRDYVEGTGGRLRLVADYGEYEIDVDLPVLHRDNAIPEREFRVVWQNLQTRKFVHVGWLRVGASLFTFTYTPDAELDPDFEPFAAFPDLRRSYRSAELFPFFADRVVSAAQPGFDELIFALGLERGEATPVELLARSWGRSSHDTIHVVPEPVQASDGTQTRLFLVSGVSHVDEKHPDIVTERIAKLVPGQRLALRDEPSNPINSNAIMIEADGHQVGWIPDYLLDDVHKALSTSNVDVFVEHANGDAAPWHLRLLCRLELRTTA